MKELDMNLQIFKKFCLFVTIPVYYWAIISTYETLHRGDFNVEESTTESTNVRLSQEYPTCIQEKYDGSSLQWLKIEIMGFFANIIVLILYLASSRFSAASAQSHIEMEENMYCDDFNKEIN